MRGFEKNTDALFVYISPESFVPSDHAFRPIRIMADKALDALSGEFNPDVLAYRQDVGAAGGALEIAPVADPLFSPEQPTIGGATRVQHSGPAVSGAVP